MKTNIKYLAFHEKNNPDLLTAVNEVAGLMDRKPHDAAARLLLEACNYKIAELRAEKQEKQVLVS